MQQDDSHHRCKYMHWQVSVTDVQCLLSCLSKKPATYSSKNLVSFAIVSKSSCHIMYCACTILCLAPSRQKKFCYIKTAWHWYVISPCCNSSSSNSDQLQGKALGLRRALPWSQLHGSTTPRWANLTLPMKFTQRLEVRLRCVLRTDTFHRFWTFHTDTFCKNDLPLQLVICLQWLLAVLNGSDQHAILLIILARSELARSLTCA